MTVTGAPGTVRAADKGATPSPAQLSAAKGFFANGQALYAQGKYEAAWLEFSSAYEMVPLPDLLFNMARCEAKLGRNADAARHYREFLKQSPSDPEAAKIQAEIARLEGAPSEPAAPAAPASGPGASPSPAEPPARRIPLITTVAGGTAVVLLIAGAATLGYVGGQYGDLKARCNEMCSPTEWTGLRSASYAGYALLGLSAAAVAVAAVALPFELKKARERRVALSIGLGSLGLAGGF
ncbi:MAG: tetratricopeptide repeat protein [Polyangia bacterium]